MVVRNLTNTSIQAALAEARELFGDEVVLLESAPAQGAAPARITVMVDGTTAPKPVARGTTAPKSAAPKPPTTGGFGYHSAARPPVEEKQEAPKPDPTRQPAPPPRLDAATRPQPPAVRGTLFPGTAEAPVPSPGPAPERLYQAQLQMLHQRLEQIERRLSPAVVGASMQWLSHPLFASLIQKGMRPATVAGLFDTVIRHGHPPDGAPDELRWALAQEMRKALVPTSVKQTTGTLMFIGPGGSGKTSLVLKLATHPHFFARRDPAVIVVAPEQEDGFFYQDPVPLYQHYGLPVQSVHNAEEMRAALHRVAHFEQVLIDTPSLPSGESDTRRTLSRIRQMVQGITPMQTHYVLNASYDLQQFGKSRLESLPQKPDAVALTHLDETVGWGRVADWLLTHRQPVQFFSTGARVPDGVSMFSPTAMVETVMEL